MHRSRTYSGTADPSEDISLIRAMIFDLQEEKENLKHANKTVLEEIYQKQKSLDELHQQVGLTVINVQNSKVNLMMNLLFFYSSIFKQCGK